MSAEWANEVIKPCLYTLDAATKKHKRWIDGLLVQMADATVALFDSEWTAKICEASDDQYLKARAKGNGATFVMGPNKVLIQLVLHEDASRSAENTTRRGASTRSAFAAPRRQCLDDVADANTDCEEQKCCYSLDPAFKKRKAWRDGVVRLPKQRQRLIEKVALLDRMTGRRIAETSHASYENARSTGSTFFIDGRVFVRLLDSVPVDEEWGNEPVVPPSCTGSPGASGQDGRPNRDKTVATTFRAPNLHSRPFANAVHEIERLLGTTVAPLLSLPRLAVLSTARRTPEEPAAEGGFVNYWEAAVLRESPEYFV